MKMKKRLLGASVATLAMMGMAEVASASLIITEPAYFVRPALRIGAAELIEGIIVNGETESTNSQGVVGYSESTVNLADGTVKMYSEEHNYGQLDGLQTFGSFGERITITGGAGTNWDMSFALEGSLYAEGGSLIIPDNLPPPRIFYDVGIAVYEPGQAEWSNFVGIANDPDDGIEPLLFEYSFYVDYIDSEIEEVFYDIFAEVSGSIALDTDYEVFDIFAYTNVSIWTNFGDGLDYYEADFMNTASFDLQFAPGVNAYSSSGQFMGLSTPPPVVNVPEPGTFLLLGLGLVAFGTTRSRKP